mmetsp:Transcript_7014/g.24357  ORF Transcript_7014/g.24357 Transcript_7014/m.24357 type:complete len:233 (-) Transcript_7014:159-857(-)
MPVDNRALMPLLAIAITMHPWPQEGPALTPCPRVQTLNLSDNITVTVGLNHDLKVGDHVACLFSCTTRQARDVGQSALIPLPPPLLSPHKSPSSQTRETVPVGEVSLKVEDLGRLSFNDKRAQISKSFGWDLLGGADITLGLGIGYTDGAPNIKFDYLPRPNVLKAIAGGLALRTGQRIHAAPSVKLLSGGPVEAAVEMDLAVLRRGVSEGRGANGALILDLCAINGLIYLD